MNEQILNLLKEQYPNGVLFHNTVDMGVFEFGDKPLYFSTDDVYWKKNGSFDSITRDDEIVYFPRLEYEEYQKEVLRLLKNPRNDLDEQLIKMTGKYGKNRVHFLEEGHWNKNIAMFLWDACKGNEIYTEHTILDDAHVIGEYNGCWFETKGQRPEEFIYNELYHPNHPQIEFLDFLLNDYGKPHMMQELLDKNGCLPKIETKSEPTRVHRYYSPFRPIQIGGYPKEQTVAIHNYNSKIALPEFNREVYGYIDTKEELPIDLKNNYELYEEKELKIFENEKQSISFVTKESALECGDEDAFYEHMDESLDALTRLEDTLSNVHEDVFVIVQISKPKHTIVERSCRVCDVDTFYDLMHSLVYKNGLDIGHDTQNNFLTIFGYGDLYTKTIDGVEMDGMEMEKITVSFIPRSDLREGSKLVAALDKKIESGQDLTAIEMNLCGRTTELNAELMRSLHGKTSVKEKDER